MILEILATVLAGWLLLWSYMRIRYRDFFHKLEKIPGPKPLPFLGNLLEFSSDPVEILEKVKKLSEDYPSIYRSYLGSFKGGVNLHDAKYIEILLSSQKHITKGDEYEFLRSWIGDGLLTATGIKWKNQRRLLTPAFHFKILEEFIDRFDANSDVLVEKLQKEVGKEYFDVYPYITMAALDMICETAMGISINAQSNPETNYVQAVRDMCNILINRTFSLFRRSNFIFRFTKDYELEHKSLEILHGLTNSVIEKRRAELKNRKTGHKEEDDDNIGRKRKVAFLDLLLESTMDGKPLPAEYIREEVDTFMFEGHDTVSSAIAFGLYLISTHPDVQQNIIEELRTIFGDDPKRAATYQDLQDMKYLDMVVKETLRLNPSVPTYNRHIYEDLDLGDYVIPKGATAMVYPYALHRNPEYFPDPEKFDPERFNPENSSKRHPYAYVPFSAGPRNCIGQKFAMLEMKSVLAKVLKNYKLLPGGPALKLSFEVVLKSRNGVPIKLEKRTDF